MTYRAPFARLCLAMLVLASGLLGAKPATAQTSGGVSWNGWTLDYAVSGNFDGLSLTTVRYQGRTVIGKISFPVMRVFYENNACGPYADRLGGTLTSVPWANNATIVQRTFTLGSRQWYELGIRDIIGNYDIYQVYYLSDDGIIDAHIYSKGLQCNFFHIHYPNWRIDFDLDDGLNDQMQGFRSGAFQTFTTEFNQSVTAVDSHRWRVRDAITGMSVDLLPGFTDFTIPDANNQPLFDYSQNTIFSRLFNSSEDETWAYGPNTQVPFNNGETVDRQDLVVWYEGYMPHSPAEGPDLWHSIGLRMKVNLTTAPSPTDTPAPAPTATPVPPTSIPTAASATSTSVPATKPPPIATATQVPPTQTPAATATGTPRPTALPTQTPRPTATNTPIPTLPAVSSANCALEGSIRSISANTPVTLRVYNNSFEIVRMYWIDYSGRRQYFGSIWPGAGWSARTYATHPWVIGRSSTGSCIKLIRDAALAPNVNVR